MTQIRKNTALEAACAALSAQAAVDRAARAAAESAIANRIIAANAQPAFGYGMLGGMQMMLCHIAPTASYLKRKAAEAIVAHRRMRAAGGNSERWLSEARQFRSQAFALSRGAEPVTLPLAAE